MKALKIILLLSSAFLLICFTSCNPTPAEKLLMERIQRDSLAADSVARAQAIRDSLQRIVDTPLPISTPEPTSIETLEPDTAKSRLQQVIDVFTDTSLTN